MKAIIEIEEKSPSSNDNQNPPHPLLPRQSPPPKANMQISKAAKYNQ
jgi:hypothetical protein